jgi:hypothetical protein
VIALRIYALSFYSRVTGKAGKYIAPALIILLSFYRRVTIYLVMD